MVGIKRAIYRGKVVVEYLSQGERGKERGVVLCGKELKQLKKKPHQRF
jgi:hypothetical protein